MTTLVPLILLGVDGVLCPRNCSPDNLPALHRLPQMNETQEVLHYRPRILSHLAEIHTSGQAEINWFTCRDKPNQLFDAVKFGGFPELAGPCKSGAWKQAAVRELLAIERTRRVIWLEDQFPEFVEAVDALEHEFEQHENLIPFPLNPRVGLTLADVGMLRDLLAP